jgi:hypothetical protein
MKLLPCPFCGFMPTILNDFDHYSVVCKNIDCDLQPNTRFYDDQEFAIITWNTRLGKDRTPKEGK